MEFGPDGDDDYRFEAIAKAEPPALRLCESRAAVALAVGLVTLVILAVFQPPLVQSPEGLCPVRLLVWGAVASALVFAAPLVLGLLRGGESG